MPPDWLTWRGLHEAAKLDGLGLRQGSGGLPTIIEEIQYENSDGSVTFGVDAKLVSSFGFRVVSILHDFDPESAVNNDDNVDNGHAGELTRGKSAIQGNVTYAYNPLKTDITIRGLKERQAFQVFDAATGQMVDTGTTLDETLTVSSPGNDYAVIVGR
jgi:hypothetical protein